MEKSLSMCIVHTNNTNQYVTPDFGTVFLPHLVLIYMNIVNFTADKKKQRTTNEIDYLIYSKLESVIEVFISFTMMSFDYFTYTVSVFLYTWVIYVFSRHFRRTHNFGFDLLHLSLYIGLLKRPHYLYSWCTPTSNYGSNVEKRLRLEIKNDSFYS